MRITIKAGTVEYRFSNPAEGFNLDITDDENTIWSSLTPEKSLAPFVAAVADFSWSNGLDEVPYDGLQEMSSALQTALQKINEEMEYRRELNDSQDILKEEGKHKALKETPRIPVSVDALWKAGQSVLKEVQEKQQTLEEALQTPEVKAALGRAMREVLDKAIFMDRHRPVKGVTREDIQKWSDLKEKQEQEDRFFKECDEIVREEHPFPHFSDVTVEASSFEEALVKAQNKVADMQEYKGQIKYRCTFRGVDIVARSLRLTNTYHFDCQAIPF